MTPVAANLTDPLVGGINGVLAYAYVPILDTVEVPWSQRTYQTNAEIISTVAADMTGKDTTVKVMANKVIKDNN